LSARAKRRTYAFAGVKAARRGMALKL